MSQLVTGTGETAAPDYRALAEAVTPEDQWGPWPDQQSALWAIMRAEGLHGAEVGALTRKYPRTVRRWLAAPGTEAAQRMPRKHWRRLLLALAERREAGDA